MRQHPAMDAPAPARAIVAHRRGTHEIVALLAGMMAMNALALDTMLPALPAIGADLGIAAANRTQLVIVAYMFGFGASQLLWGPLADRFGRRPVLLAGVSLYVLFGLLAAAAGDFTLLIAARFAMGACGAVSRVLVLAIVRDLYEGEEMARIMSLTQMTFMVVPVIAPSLGQLVLAIAPWRAIFYGLAAYGVLLFAWSAARLPETLHAEHRRAIRPASLAQGLMITATDRLSLGYTLALTAVFTTLVAYLASVQQIIGTLFGAGERLGTVFAMIAAPMALASFTNSRIVRRFGLRRVGHAGLVAFVGAALFHLGWHLLVGSTLESFVVLMALVLVAFAFTTSNFGTLAMTNMAPVAGIASSVQGTASTVGAAVLGFAIGQAFDGTLLPFLVGITLSGLAALALTLVTERGRLFHRRYCPLPPLPADQ
ncbi:multidrug effflux MFS transporter [Sphingomicrobium astaxanthinifaciens]|uniref:multidrug effflux MFS transporter n=1 Tax=Sphingomicrobium astaxanthinifaciens TaxID=1227949 RepID=UPI001FCAFE38|nr:multidrug effflux MFS transporter [Sphingomicrobium astaxanthinifaciens]MCJ7422241.1 multidrug effflux MFS transporter [Sphingomicrobium astaxanthinifaciens]